MALSQEHEAIVLMNCTNARIFISKKIHTVSKVGNVYSYCNVSNIFWVPPNASPRTRCRGWEGNKTCLQLSVTLLDAGDTQMIEMCSLPASGMPTMVVIGMKTNDHHIQSETAQIAAMRTRLREQHAWYAHTNHTRLPPSLHLFPWRVCKPDHLKCLWGTFLLKESCDEPF